MQAQGGPPPGPPPKKSSVGLIIGLVVGGLVVLIGVIAVVMFVFVGGGIGGKTSSKAHAHLPATCEVVLRVDSGGILELDAFKKHVMPALEELQSSGGSAGEDAKEVEAFFRKAAIDPRSDVKEAVLCMSGIDNPGGQKMAFVFGGEFRPEVVADALRDTSTKDKIEMITIDGRKAAKKTSGELMIAGQAADGAIVLANDQSLYEAAVKTSAAYQGTYVLPMDAEASFVVTGAFIQRAGASNLRGNPLADDVAATTRVSGVLALKNNPHGEVRVTMKTEKNATDLSQAIEKLILPGIKSQAGRQKSVAGEIEALNAAKVRAEGKDVVLELPWSAAGVDQAAQKLAQLIRDAKKKKGLSL
ncbi:MAG: hypothetical protein IT372_03060 [Polyangiaceae bacterium]|nr:hypothetical protein [Polyangiaceae bacterium]